MKKVCYTAVTGNYDKVVDPIVVSPEFDYICFTDHPFSSGVWKCLPIPSELQWLSNVKKQRVVKICPHRYLSEYDISIWVDGNIKILRDLNQLVEIYDLEKTPFYTRIHPKLNCVYDEGEAIIELGKDSRANVEPILERYKREGYPAHIGMTETCVILRKHNDKRCILLDNAWATELLLNSHRDQLSFNYICWKQGFLPGYMTNELNIRKNNFFYMNRHA